MQRDQAAPGDNDDEPLELTPDMQAEPPEDEPGEGDDEGEEETVVRFEDEPEPGSTEDTPVIRQMRDRLKELGRENEELRSKTESRRQEQELGPKPTLGGFNYDEDKYEAALDAWKERKREIDAEANSRDAEQLRAEREWQGDMAAYVNKRDALGVSDFEDAAEVVKSALNLAQQATIIKAASNPAAFVYGLAHSDTRLAEISRVKDPIKLAALIARMEGGLKVVKRRRAAAPDRPVKGSARLPGGTDKVLESLEAEAAKTGNRTKVIAYKRKLRNQQAKR